MRALDRYTLPVRARRAAPRFAGARRRRPAGAVAREVVEHYGERGDGASGRHRAVPPGSVAARSSIVLERNPEFREQRFDAEPRADDAKATRCSRASGPAPAAASTASRSRSSTRRSRAGSRSSTASMTLVLPPAVRTARDAGRPHRAKPRRSGESAHVACSAPSRSPSSTWMIRWSAAMRRRRSRCAAPSRSPTTSPRDTRAGARRAGVAAQSTIVPHTYGYDPALVAR